MYQFVFPAAEQLAHLHDPLWRPTNLQTAAHGPGQVQRRVPAARNTQTLGLDPAGTGGAFDGNLGQAEAAKSINAACAKIVADKSNHTRDLGGTASTGQISDAVAALI